MSLLFRLYSYNFTVFSTSTSMNGDSISSELRLHCSLHCSLDFSTVPITTHREMLDKLQTFFNFQLSTTPILTSLIDAQFRREGGIHWDFLPHLKLHPHPTHLKLCCPSMIYLVLLSHPNCMWFCVCVCVCVCVCPVWNLCFVHLTLHRGSCWDAVCHSLYCWDRVCCHSDPDILCLPGLLPKQADE